MPWLFFPFLVNYVAHDLKGLYELRNVHLMNFAKIKCHG